MCAFLLTFLLLNWIWILSQGDDLNLLSRRRYQISAWKLLAKVSSGIPLKHPQTSNDFAEHCTFPAPTRPGLVGSGWILAYPEVGFFLRKKPLASNGFELKKSWNRCSPGNQADSPRFRVLPKNGCFRNRRWMDRGAQACG
jgi:hypothetical protein